MRATPVSLVSFALLFGLANTAGAYDSTCKPPLTGEQEVEPVVMATYSCSRWGDGNHYTGHNEPAGTPKDCAIACSKRSPEGPCTWYSNTCYFYKPGAPTVAAASAHSEAVTIETRKDWDRLKLAYDQCDANCQSSGGNGGPPGGGGNDQDKGLAWPAGCGHEDKAKVTAKNGEKFDVYCNQLDERGGGGQIGYFVTIEECIERCSLSSNCVRAVYQTDKNADGTRYCYNRPMYGSYREPAPSTKPDQTSYYTTAHKQV